jgi:hypothetical protein
MGTCYIFLNIFSWSNVCSGEMTSNDTSHFLAEKKNKRIHFQNETRD